MSTAELPSQRDTTRRGGRRRLQVVTGWSLLVAAAGIFIDAWAHRLLEIWRADWLAAVVSPNGPGGGNVGLVPAYLGVIVGMPALLAVLRRMIPTWAVVLAGVGVLGMLTFWGSYPDHATLGGLGSVLIGVALLAYPGWGRLASLLWIASGLPGVLELVEPGASWGPVSGFTLLGAAIGVTGASLVHDARSAASPTELER